MDISIILIVLTTSIWVLIDAKNLGVKKGLIKGIGNMGPWGWFIVCLLIWIIAFPIYLFKRSEYKRLARLGTSNNNNVTAKVCAKCGTNTIPNQKFCGSCGAPVEVNESDMSVHKSNGGSPKTILIVSLLSIITISALYFLGVNADSDNLQQASGETKESSVIAIGDTFQEEQIEGTITSVFTRDNVGNEFISSAASEGGLYIVMQWKYKNVSDKPIGMFNIPTVNLIDPDGNQYDADLDATSTFAVEAKNDEKILSDLNPGITVSGSKVFEIAKDKFSDDWKIKIGETLINIKEKPDTASQTPSKIEETNIAVNSNEAEVKDVSSTTINNSENPGLESTKVVQMPKELFGKYADNQEQCAYEIEFSKNNSGNWNGTSIDLNGVNDSTISSCVPVKVVGSNFEYKITETCSSEGFSSTSETFYHLEGNTLNTSGPGYIMKKFKCDIPVISAKQNNVEMSYAKDNNILILTSIDPKKLQFNLNLGINKGDLSCKEGYVSCVPVEGSATSKNGINYTYINAEYDCVFDLAFNTNNISISNSKGICGTGSANRNVLGTINGIYNIHKT